MSVNWKQMIDQTYQQAYNLYWTQDLDGEIFTQPLKHYHDYMIHLVDQSSDLQHIIYRIIHIATGLVIYPLFGALAAFGMLIKLTQGSCVTRNNENQKKNLWMLVLKPLNLPGDKPNKHLFVTLNTAPWKLYPFVEFRISPDVLNSMSDDDRNYTVKEIEEQIDKCTKQYKKIYISSISNCKNGALINLYIYQTDSIYFKNRPFTLTRIFKGQTSNELCLSSY